MLAGSVFHAALCRRWVKPEDDQEEYIRIACAVLAKGEVPEGMRLEHWNGQVLGDAPDPEPIIGAYQLYVRTYPTTPALVEHVFERTVDLDLFPVVLWGVVDAVDAWGNIIDYKFSSQVPDMAQLALYAFGMGKPISNCHAYHLCQPDAVQVIPLSWDEETLQNYLHQVVRPVARALRYGVFPARTDGWWCSEQRCAYYSMCVARRTI